MAVKRPNMKASAAMVRSPKVSRRRTGSAMTPQVEGKEDASLLDDAVKVVEATLLSRNTAILERFDEAIAAISTQFQTSVGMGKSTVSNEGSHLLQVRSLAAPLRQLLLAEKRRGGHLRALKAEVEGLLQKLKNNKDALASAPQPKALPAPALLSSSGAAATGLPDRPKPLALRAKRTLKA